MKGIWRQGLKWVRLLGVAGLLMSVVSGCELDFTDADENSKNVNTSEEGEQGAPEEVDTSGSGTLIVYNSAPYYIYPSIDDTTAGGSLIKLGHIDSGASRSYTIPSGLHFLCIYSAESDMQYQDTEYFAMEPDATRAFEFDGAHINAR